MSEIPDIAGEAEFSPLEDAGGAGAAHGGDLAPLHEVPVELAVEIGRTRMTIGDTLALGPGSIVTLDRLAGEPVDLLVNGRAIARGEVVVIGEEFGFRVTEVVGAPAPAPAPNVPEDPA
jgi:flagellar motor switch protein FliN/FliY